ncbi:MAG: multiheme c-type cytochrome [Chitinophagaceae bacterium]
MTIHRRTVITLALIVLAVFLLIQCTGNKGKESTTIKDARGEVFTGSAVCASCHKEIYEDHIRSGHFNSTQFASAKNIKGSFDAGQNEFVYTRHAKIMMEKRDSSLYQVAYEDGKETKSRRFDIVVGSGNKGQTYLYWMEKRLFQLPISYFGPADQWSNSPGFPNRIVFNRPITSRCLECHSTFAKTISEPGKIPEEFDRSQLLLTVGCEKCHGPGGKHVEYQQQHPGDTTARYIVDPARFSRQQSLDLCALCHGGRLDKTQPSFSYESGDKLTDYFSFDTVGRNAADIDVHGNQLGLLAASKCFTMSQMTCNSCHDTHKNEKGQLALFSQRCMNCHTKEKNNFCKMSASIGPGITQNCIDCHLPKQQSHAIAVYLQGADAATAVSMRTHYIKVYPEESRKQMISLGKFLTDPHPANH